MVAVRLPNWLGDVLLARRAVELLARREGESRLSLAARPAHVALLRPEWPRARWLATGHGAGAALALGRRWREAGVEEVRLFPTSLSSRLAGWTSGARRRIGFAPRGDHRLAPPAGWLLTRPVPRGRLGERHLEDEFLDLVRDGEEPLPERRPLALPPGDGESGLPALARRPYLVLSPGARYGPAKRWPAERFAQAALEIAAELGGADVAVVGEDADREAGEAVLRLLGAAAVPLVGRTDLPLLARVLRGSLAVISNDSGTAHLAAALERPTVVIFGSTEPRWTAPRGERVAVLSEPVRCTPCFRRACPLTDSYACLRTIEPRAVVRSLRALLERKET